MSLDIEQLLRDELRGAATGAPHHLGVDDQDVLTRGRRVVVRRRILTVAGAAAATLVIAGTIGMLAPRAGDGDTLPAIPTPTVTPTPDPTPAISSTATPSATVTPSVSVTTTPTTTPSPSASRTRTPSHTPSPPRTKSASPSPSTTPSVNDAWTDPVTLDGVRYRTRLVNPHLEGDYMIVEVEVEADGTVIFTKRGQDYGEKGTRGLAPDVLLLYNVSDVKDVVSENGEPVKGEEFGTFAMPFPKTENTITYTIVTLPRPVTRDANGSLKSLILMRPNGTTYGLGIDDPDS